MNINKLSLPSMSSLLAAINFDSVMLFAAIGLIVSVSTVLFFKEDKHSWHKQAPSLITTLGIFCTFVGITVGLLRFDPNNESSLNYFALVIRYQHADHR